MRAFALSMRSAVRNECSRLWGARDVANDDRSHLINLSGVALGLMVIGAPLIFMGLFDFIKSDHDLHLGLIQRGIESGNWPVHFLFPAFVYALSGFSHDFARLGHAALVLLTACLVAKGCMTYIVLVRSGRQTPTAVDSTAPRWSRETLLLMVTTALMLAAPVVRPWRINRVYMGQISPNLWHNPTSLVCWPLAILLFFAAYQFLSTRNVRILSAVGVLALLSVLAKPNYFLAFAPVFGLLSLRRLGLSRLWILSQAAMLPTVAVLYWQVTASFNGPGAMRPDRAIAWMPLAAWHFHSNSIPLSLLFSLAFPLSYIVVFWRSITNGQLLTFAWLVMLSALAWTACFAEISTLDGSVDGDFNFSWGAHISLFLLFLVTAIDMCSNATALQAIDRHAIGGWQARLPWWLLGAHAASGVFWLVRQAAGRGYY